MDELRETMNCPFLNFGCLSLCRGYRIVFEVEAVSQSRVSYLYVLGTRPEIIKASTVVRELKRGKLSHFILHTGQHYSYNIDRLFLEQLKLTEPKYNLEVGTH